MHAKDGQRLEGRDHSDSSIQAYYLKAVRKIEMICMSTNTW